MRKITTDFTKLLDIDLPIIGAPMFLVSNVEMVVAISEAGGVGTFPALNYRPIAQYKEALKEMKTRTKKPIGVNVIVNKSNTRQRDDLKHALDAGIDLFITSLGSPRDVIAEAHKNGAKVFCDVTSLEHAKKVEDLGADGVIAVSSGAGGHAGPISSQILIPWLKSELKIPVVAAGGVADGKTLASVLALGASAAHIGTRFIASTESEVQDGYKNAIIESSPEDIVLTTKISGTPISVINTEYFKKNGLELAWWIKKLKDNPKTKKYVVGALHFMGSKSLEVGASKDGSIFAETFKKIEEKFGIKLDTEASEKKMNWKSIWSAGQTVGLIDEISSCKEIIDQIVEEYYQTVDSLPKN